MKKIVAVIIAICVFTGCAAQQTFVIPPGKSQQDYADAKQECANEYPYTTNKDIDLAWAILFPPLIPVYAIMIWSQNNQRHGFAQCMESLGFKSDSARNGGNTVKPDAAQ